MTPAQAWKAAHQTLCLAVLCHTDNRFDGERYWLDGDFNRPTNTRLFATRTDARAFIAERHGYIRDRADLRAEPHGWRMPKPVRVTVNVVLAAAHEGESDRG